MSAELQGGKFGHGFVSAGIGFGTGLATAGKPSFGKLLLTVTIGGTLSDVTGGKFANGALSAAMAYVVAIDQRDSGRPLTNKEKAEARKAYGDQIPDYDSVRYFGRKWAFFQPDRIPMSPNGNIYWPAAADCAGLTTCVITLGENLVETRLTFIHEMGHVMQYQNGMNLVLSAGPYQILHILTLGLYDPYINWQQFKATPTPLGLNPEAQADWYMWNYYKYHR